jgi:hypothetical protein
MKYPDGTRTVIQQSCRATAPLSRFATEVMLLANSAKQTVDGG